MIPALLALAVCAAPQEGADAARERLQALVASTNDLKGFRAVYLLARGEEELGRVELSYLAPDRLLLTNRSDQGWADVCLDGERLWMASESPGAGELAGAFALDDAGGVFEEALSELAETFPRPEGQVDVSVRLAWGVNLESDKTEFDLSVSYVRAGEERLLGWLQTMLAAEGELALENGMLVHTMPRVRAEVDAQTGFLKSLLLTGSDGEVRDLRLVELDLEGPFDGDRFLRPEPSEAARDISDALRAQVIKPASLRADCLLQIDSELKRGRAWDEATKAGTRDFLAALHRPVLAANVARWRASVLKGIDEFAAELDAKRQEGVDEAELTETIDARRAQLVESTAETRTRLVESLAAATRNDAPSAHWVDVRSLEDEVLAELFREEVEEPLLAAFDERT